MSKVQENGRNTQYWKNSNIGKIKLKPKKQKGRSFYAAAFVYND